MLTRSSVGTFALALSVATPALSQQSAECVGVYDSVGARVARVMDLESPRAVFVHQGQVTWLYVYSQDALRGSESAYVYFTEANCTGEAFMIIWDVDSGAAVANSTVWHPDMFATPANVTTNSSLEPGGVCQPGSQTTEMVPALTFTLPTFTPPFHLEPEPCTSPEVVAALTPFSLLAMAVLLGFGAYVIRVRRVVRSA